ncbi:hypothetical protein [Salibacterium lacus]|uniref:Uncharacterized protein n=1 Tax=Salibacterium lacus TaxID=1898109 RepID=A0ABW5SZU9_9BACI
MVQEPYNSGAKMFRLLLRTARVTGTPQEAGQVGARQDVPVLADLPLFEPYPRQRRHDEIQRTDVTLVLWSESEAFWRSGLSQ